MNDTTENKLRELLSRLENVKQSGSNYSARCPAHDDRQASLSIGIGDAGRVLLHCHAGCQPDAVVGVLGMTLRDLAPASSINNQRKQQAVGKSKGFPFPTWEAAAEVIAKQSDGKVAATWPYHDASGNEVLRMVRVALPSGGKSYRPVRHDDDGWRIGGLEKTRPLYRLAELAGASRVYITEGEKAVDAARSIGLVATTSMHGAQSPAKTDWTPLAGKEVVIFPDNDDVGKDYAAMVAAILLAMSPPALVRVVELPGLPPKGDIFDWLELREGAEPAALKEQVEKLADAVAVLPVPVAVKSIAKPKMADSFQPFPVDVFPSVVQKLIFAAGKAMVCDAAFIAVPILSVLAACIGNSRRIQLKRGWSEPSIIWALTVATSGTMKTQGYKVAIRPLIELQGKAMTEHAKAVADHLNAVAEYERELAKWRQKKDAGEPPVKPLEPAAHRIVVSDTTTEALAPIMQANPNGLLLARDELSGWFGGLDRYANKKGSDSANWLSIHSGDAIIVDRKTGTPRTTFIKRTAVSIAGTIQPYVLVQTLGREYCESGMAARFLFAMPPRAPKKWTDADIDPELEADYAGVLDVLLTLEPAGDEEDWQPVLVPLTASGLAEFIPFFNEHNLEQDGLDGDLVAAWSKLEGYAARLALVIHYTRWAAGDDTVDPNAVDEQSVQAGIKLSRWFGNEAKRLYGQLAETDVDRERRELTELIRRKGGNITARELMRSSRKYPAVNDAEPALIALVQAGIARWEPVPPTEQGGHPTRTCKLIGGADVDTTPKNPVENIGSVNVSDDDSGEEVVEWTG